MSFFFIKQKTADDVRISDWSSDVCSSDLDLMALDIALDNPDALSQRAVGIAPVIVKRLRRHSHSPCEDHHHSYCAHSPVPNGSGSSDCGAIGRASCRDRVGKNV